MPTAVLWAGHTVRDFQALIDGGADPSDTQPRERSVPCAACGRPTWHLAAVCDAHYSAPRAAR